MEDGYLFNALISPYWYLLTGLKSPHACPQTTNKMGAYFKERRFRKTF